MLRILLLSSVFIITACVSTKNRSTASDPTTAFMQSLPPVEAERKHVHLMHLDGFRADIFKALLEKGRLPHFQFLLGRGKISFEASTVDKSETFKVIESYLTSRRDTFITGWWQFDRTQFKFKNYWIDPPEVVNYELGLMFPSAPTIYDVVTSKSGPNSVAAGFTLHRRSVPARLYTRNFAAGYKSVSEHVYYDQAHQTMGNFLQLMKKLGSDASYTIPKFTSTLLAPADEWGHLRGVEDLNEGSHTETCFKRNDPRTEILFKFLDDPQLVGIALPETHFTKVNRGWGKANEFCIDRFKINIANEPMPTSAESTVGVAKPKWVNPWYVLGMIQVDMELGRMIDEMRRIQFYCLDGKDHCYSQNNPRGIASYINNGKAEGSLFENTLFLFTGDHGMVDSKHMMIENTAFHRENGRSNNSKSQSLLELLNAGMGLKVPSALNKQGPFGVNDTQLPESLKYPFEDVSWQSPAIRAKVQEAQAWSQVTFTEIQAAIKDKQYQKYWWLTFLKSRIIDPKVATSTEAIKPFVTRMLTGLYLQGDLCAQNPQCYVKEEARFLKKFYDQNIKFVYGGAALNNAEFFFPSAKGWSERPNGSEIFEMIPGKRKTVIKTLQDMESIGLIFVRTNNEEFHSARPVPESSEIMVTDAMNNLGMIHVRRDADTGILLFAYTKMSEVDPLGYGNLGQALGEPLKYRTYDEWNRLSVENKHYYHNVVAGMGTYLFSNNPHIGDVSVMHREGWNFGENAGGHGGIHREEKLTTMMASGPGIQTGMLLSRERYRLNSQTQKVVSGTADDWTYPTIVDLAPTALKWLYNERDSLYSFQIEGYEDHLKNWKKTQVAEFTDDVIAGFENEMRGTSNEGMIDLRRIRPRLQRLFQFMDNQQFEVPNGYLNRQPDGNQLNL